MAAAVGAAVLALCGIGGCAGRRAAWSRVRAVGTGEADPEARFTPRDKGASHYGQPARPAAPLDPLGAAVLDDARRIAAAGGLVIPIGDARLDAMMEDVARGLRGGSLPSAAVTDFLNEHHGIVEPAPRLNVASGPPGSDWDLRQLIASQLPATLRSGKFARVGVGVDRASSALTVVVGLQESHLAIEPVARRLPRGGRAVLSGTLTGGHRDARLIMTAPDGSVHEIPVRSDAARFHGVLECNRGDGRYQLEVGGHDRLGSVVLANFPVFCGVEPPLEPPRGSASAPRWNSLGTAAAERYMLDLVNRDRTRARLPPLAWDEKLAEVARAHSRDMADGGFVGHISPRTGNPADRVKRAGMALQLVMENVASVSVLEDAQDGFMRSPGHRANIIDGRATRLGVGIVLAKEDSGAAVYYVTQLFGD